MRQYRGKSIESGDWVYGGAYLNYYIVTGGRNIRDEEGEMTTIVKVDPNSIGESTGKYDKNDIEIFERDWIMVKGEQGYIFFNEGSFRVEFGDGDDVLLHDISSKDIVVMDIYGIRENSKLNHSPTASPSPSQSFSGSISPSASEEVSASVSGSVSPSESYEPDDDIDIEIVEEFIRIGTILKERMEKQIDKKSKK